MKRAHEPEYTRNQIGSVDSQCCDVLRQWKTASDDEIRNVKALLTSLFPGFEGKPLLVICPNSSNYLIRAQYALDEFLHVSEKTNNVYHYENFPLDSEMGEMWFLDEGVFGPEKRPRNRQDEIVCQFADGEIIWDKKREVYQIRKTKAGLEPRYKLSDVSLVKSLDSTKPSAWTQLLNDLGFTTEPLKELISFMLIDIFIAPGWSRTFSLPTIIGNYEALSKVFGMLFPEDSQFEVKSDGQSIFQLEEIVKDKAESKFWLLRDESRLSQAQIAQMIAGEQMVIPIRFKPATVLQWQLPGFALLSNHANVNQLLYGVHVSFHSTASYDLDEIRSEFPRILVNAFTIYLAWIREMDGLPEIEHLNHVGGIRISHCACRHHREKEVVTVDPAEVRKTLLNSVGLFDYVDRENKLAILLSRSRWKRLLVTKFHSAMPHLDAVQFIIYSV